MEIQTLQINDHKGLRKVMFCGGGTLGPVTPLLAIHEVWCKDPTVSFVFVGTPNGPERKLVEEQGMTFVSLPEAKFPRYPSLEWIKLPFRFFRAFFKASKILIKEKPALIVSAGGYTAVPLIIIGWFMGVPSWIHQQDVLPLLSNRLTMPFAKLITVAWPESLKFFPKNKTKLIGNPVRASFLTTSKETAIKYFGLDSMKQTIFVLGGGTGSTWINEQLTEIGCELVKEFNVIHVTGKNKMIEELKNFGINYRTFELLTKEMPLAFAAADLVICRAGMGTITELAATNKPAIIIPLPNSPQEANAAVLEKSEAAIIAEQAKNNAASLLFIIRFLLADQPRRRLISETISAILKTNIAEEMVKEGEGFLLKR